MKKIIGFCLILLLISVVVVFGSPYWTLYQLKNAYDAKDASTINQYIDFPKMQTNLEQQLTPVLIDKLNNLTSSPLLQALNVDIHADELVNKMVNQAVDNTITENGIKNLLIGQTAIANLDNNAKLLGGLIAVAMDKVDIKTLITARNQEEMTDQLKEQLSRPNPQAVPVKDSAQYCGFNCFNVQTQIQGYPITVNLQREGLINWKVVGVKLPL